MNLSRHQRALRAFLWRLMDVTPLLDGLAYRGPADFVLRHGRWMRPGPWDDGWPEGLPRRCFGNSITQAALRGWKYVEGYALPEAGRLPVQHAWNLDRSGRLADVTWRNKGVAYLGVEFALGRADDATWNGDADVLDDWRRGWPLFREPWRGEDFAREWAFSEPLRLLLAEAAASAAGGDTCDAASR